MLPTQLSYQWLVMLILSATYILPVELQIQIPPVNLLQMVTPHGGNVRMDMLSNALLLRKYGKIPFSINCNSFRCSYATDPDRVIVWDCLPVSSYVATTSATGASEGTNTTDEVVTPEEPVVPAVPALF